MIQKNLLQIKFKNKIAKYISRQECMYYIKLVNKRKKKNKTSIKKRKIKECTFIYFRVRRLLITNRFIWRLLIYGSRIRNGFVVNAKAFPQRGFFASGNKVDDIKAHSCLNLTPFLHYHNHYHKKNPQFPQICKLHYN